MIQRNTIQCALVLEVVNKLQCHATAEEVYAAVSLAYPHISRATVYRNLKRLSETGKLRRVEIPGGPDRFDHRCERHYHVKCELCGCVADVDMPYLPEMETAIKDTHGFDFTGHCIVFTGVCPRCKEKDGAQSR